VSPLWRFGSLMKRVKKYYYLMTPRLFPLFFYFFDNSFIHLVVILVFTYLTKSLGKNWGIVAKDTFSYLRQVKKWEFSISGWGLRECRCQHLDARKKCRQMGYNIEDVDPTYWGVLPLQKMKEPWQCEICGCCEPQGLQGWFPIGGDHPFSPILYVTS
jgi:hypothetical protein